MPTVLACGTRVLRRIADSHGVDIEPLFREEGLDPAKIDVPSARYPALRVYRVWEHLAKQLGMPHLGLLTATHFVSLDLHALGISFLSSSTLMSALQRIDRYEQVMHSRWDYSIIERGEQTDLVCEGMQLDGQVLRLVEDSRTAVITGLCRLAMGHGYDPLEVAFTYPEPEHTGDHYGLFRCPVLFSEPISRITFATEDLLRPLSSANRELAQSSDRIMDAMMRDLGKSDLVSRVKRSIIDELPSGTPAEEKIARDLAMSSRTLNRRLADEDTSFRELLGEVRRDLAEQYIADRNMPISEIGYMLGFSDASSFSRAFKRWTGSAPQDYRSRAGT